jgi:hypothetical protein
MDLPFHFLYQYAALLLAIYFLSLSLLLVRILGGVLQIAAQMVRPINSNLYISAAILEAAGLSPLLLATLGFVQTVYVV